GCARWPVLRATLFPPAGQVRRARRRQRTARRPSREGFLCAQLGEIHGAQGSATPGNPLSLRHARGYRLPTALLAPSALVDTARPEQERIAETDIGLTRMRGRKLT